MPIRLLKELAGKLTRKITGSDAASKAGGSTPRKKGGSVSPVPGSASVAKGAVTQVWHPGDPVPRVSRPGSGASREDARKAPPRSRSRRPVESHAAERVKNRLPL